MLICLKLLKKAKHSLLFNNLSLKSKDAKYISVVMILIIMIQLPTFTISGACCELGLPPDTDILQTQQFSC